VTKTRPRCKLTCRLRVGIAVFHSTRVQPKGDNAWKVSGGLTLHGFTKSLTLDVAGEGGGFAGTVRVIARIRQTDFGIQPNEIGGGLVKVKDRLEIIFRVYTLAH
jgi:polyisoprenoid-binding protein YceI